MDARRGAAWPAIARRALGQATLQRALIAHHQQNALLGRYLRQPLPKRVTGT